MKGGRSGMNSVYKTPCFILEQKRLDKNLEKLAHIEKESGVKILHSIKSFNQSSVLPLIASKLSGMSVGSPKELNMAQNAHAKHIHLHAPAFKKEELLRMQDSVSTLSFNSLGQWRSFLTLELKDVSLGLRINPKLHLPIPSYCNPNLGHSRLGVDGIAFIEAYREHGADFQKLEGLHFHALFQSSVQGLIILLEHIEQYYSEILPKLKWLNLGGGHNFTDANYDVQSFVRVIKKFKHRYPQLELYFEPGESVLNGCGEFIATVLDIITVAEQKVVILDTSIETHLLDVAIVNQRLKVRGTQSSSTPYYYELTGNTCLQGDIIGEYFFVDELEIGDKIVFEDMMSYSMVKMTEFNGMENAEFIVI
jgi:carboxynorspermidine decarboxylase